jgi:primase-polymerase (primpol)-like protein
VTTPSALTANIPEPLAGSKRWVCFRVVPQPDGSVKKTPLKTNGQLARSDHPEDWSTLPEVTTAIRFGIGQYPGLALGADYPLRVFDLDRCIDQDGTLSPLATDIVSRAGDTYIERSVSRRGLHVFVWKSEQDFPTHPAPGLEVYGGAPHFIVMTGDLWNR